jgi:hypothetical protein
VSLPMCSATLWKSFRGCRLKNSSRRESSAPSAW